jgi:hypothetical protein
MTVIKVSDRASGPSISHPTSQPVGGRRAASLSAARSRASGTCPVSTSGGFNVHCAPGRMARSIGQAPAPEHGRWERAPWRVSSLRRTPRKSWPCTLPCGRRVTSSTSVEADYTAANFNRETPVGTDHTRLFEPATGAVRRVSTRAGLFCCGHAMTHDGHLVVAGGRRTIRASSATTTPIGLACGIPGCSPARSGTLTSR